MASKARTAKGGLIANLWRLVRAIMIEIVENVSVEGRKSIESSEKSQPNGADLGHVEYSWQQPDQIR